MEVQRDFFQFLVNKRIKADFMLRLKANRLKPAYYFKVTQPDDFIINAFTWKNSKINWIKVDEEWGEYLNENY